MASRKQLTVAESKQSHGRTSGACPTAAMDYRCGTTEETWAEPGAQHRASTAQGLSCFAPSAKPNLSQAPILPGPPWAELPPGAAERARSCHVASPLSWPVYSTGAACQSFQQAQHPPIYWTTQISSYSNNIKLKTTTKTPSSKSTELDNSPSFNEISWLQLLATQMSNLPSDLEKQHSIASAPLGAAFGAFSTATLIPQRYTWERREGAQEVEGKASSMAKRWWKGADQLRCFALWLGSPSDFILHAKRRSPGSPRTLPHQPHSHGRGSPGDQGAKKTN